MAYVVMACILMAYILMAHISYGLVIGSAIYHHLRHSLCVYASVRPSIRPSFLASVRPSVPVCVRACAVVPFIIMSLHIPSVRPSNPPCVHVWPCRSSSPRGILCVHCLLPKVREQSVCDSRFHRCAAIRHTPQYRHASHPYITAYMLTHIAACVATFIATYTAVHICDIHADTHRDARRRHASLPDLFAVLPFVVSCLIFIAVGSMVGFFFGVRANTTYQL